MSIKLNQIMVDSKKTLGEGLVLVDIEKSFVYDKNVKTDEIDGFKYIVLSPNLAYEKVSIKIKGDSCKFPEFKVGMNIPVKFSNLEITLFQNYRSAAKEILISALADDVVEVK